MTGTITLIEQAVVDRLRTVVRPYQGLLVESYAGQLDDELFGWIRRLPAVWVTFDQVSESKRQSANVWRQSASFEVLSAQRALGENDGRMAGPERGDAVGVYQLLEDNKLALVGRKLGLPIQAFTPGVIRPVMKSMVNREAVVVYSQTFHTVWHEIYADPADDGITGELESVGFEYYLKPMHKPPGDAPDAIDNLVTQTV